jgi:hypothetical protein
MYGKTCLQGFTVLFSVAGLGFLALGCFSSFSDSTYMLTGLPWIVVEPGPNDDEFNGCSLYFSLKGYDLDYGDMNRTEVPYPKQWGDLEDSFSHCSAPFCAECEDAGDVASVVMVCSTAFSVVVLALAVAAFSTYSRELRIVNMFVALAAGVGSTLSVWHFMSTCYDAIVKGIGSEFITYWGTGSLLALSGTIVLWVVGFLQLVILCWCGKTEQISTIEPETAKEVDKMEVHYA